MRRLYTRFGKRAFDLLFSVLLLIILSPIFLVIVLFILLDTPGPALFFQKRLGRAGEIFETIKFRTMHHRPRVPDREIVGRHSELTRVGYWLRRFKLDEIPQLLNVIKGDMSLVGPRPALPDQLSEYDATTGKRLEVRPGLTGLAQISGNIHLSWPERWRYDVAYIERLSFTLDLSIILRTIPVVLLGEKRYLHPPT